MRFALCNEVLAPLGFAEQCAAAAKLGYDGLEVAPFTLAEDPTTITDGQAEQFRRMADDAGLAICGLHWLLVAPAGLSIVSEDAALRARTVGVMKRLAELCAALGGSYLVHGSPKQRSVPQGSTKEAALARATDCFAQIAPVAASLGLVYCVEPLSTRETDLVNSVAEAVRIVDHVNSPGLRTMIDCSAAGQVEMDSVADLIRRWIPSGHVAHVQANDPNRRAPGQGEMDFEPILRALRDVDYRGIVAVEPFDYVPDGPGCAAFAIDYLLGIERSLA
ncbi:sugar phosphate isomerase/epimerase family protein [Ramlibacter sp. PS4R-6]|uniref:sugar phosphate isomerase/epimerase family protein n=1 Tax=Ramlibacter sp. PS4R-6 TaxID=3133438 RepID=UPI0030ADCBCB